MRLAQAVGVFFRIGELAARAFLTDGEVFTWIQDRYRDLDFGRAWS